MAKRTSRKSAVEIVGDELDDSTDDGVYEEGSEPVATPVKRTKRPRKTDLERGFIKLPLAKIGPAIERHLARIAADVPGVEISLAGAAANMIVRYDAQLSCLGVEVEIETETESAPE